MKFNADSEYEKKNGVSRAFFRDNQHLLDAYARVFEAKIAPPEVIRKKITTHKIIVLCRLYHAQMPARVSFYNTTWIFLNKKQRNILICHISFFQCPQKFHKVE